MEKLSLNLMLTAKAGLCLAVLFLASCTSYQPPRRPVANLFPTVVPMGDIRELLARPTTPEQVRNYLEFAGLLKPLRSFGMMDADVNTMARALSGRGYAELDCRKCPKCPVRWVALRREAEDQMLVVAGFDKLPPKEHQHGIDFSAEAARTTAMDTYGNPKIVDTWARPPFLVRRILLVSRPQQQNWELQADACP